VIPFGPALENRNVPQIVMGKLVSHDKGDLVVCRADLVKAARKVDVATRTSESRHLLEPWNFDDQADPIPDVRPAIVPRLA
jgi:hypothetical protein